MASQGVLPNVSYPYLLVTGCVLVTTFLLSVAIWRLYFHPLAKYPGPFWARLSTFPSWWHTVKQDRHVWLYSLQEQYGTLLRVLSLSVYLQCTNIASRSYVQIPS